VKGAAPFILTAELPVDLARWATGLRQEHFPIERNFLPAHVTLFHSLPPSAHGEIKRALAQEVAENSPVEAILEGLMPLGKGTALKITSPGMVEVWQRLADRFHGLLTPQDEHEPRLHVTIQNNVSIETARALQQKLAPLIEPRPFNFAGLGLYIYRGGPWELARTYPFRR